MAGRARAWRGIWLVALLALAACVSRQAHSSAPLANGTTARIGILETTDLHSHVVSYDYYRNRPDPDVGLERAATLIEQARKQFANTLLFDDGDTIQGTPLADYQAEVARPPCNRELAIYRAMDTLHYDAGTIGNHEFNYGLDYLSQVTGTPFHFKGIPVLHCHGPQFPLVLSNVFSLENGEPLYAPWRIITRMIRVHTPAGGTREVRLHIGLVGFTPPPIMNWDRRHLGGRVHVMDVVRAARKYVPQVRAAGADIVIALLHGGIDRSAYRPGMENPGLYLARVPGIDVMLLGHQHRIFPDPGNPHSRYAHIPGVNDTNGDILGRPAVMGDYYGKALGVIDLALVYRRGRWRVDLAKTHSQVRRVKQPDGSYVAPDTAIPRLVAHTHRATIAYVNTPIGRSDFSMNTWFAAAGDVSALQIVNMAQRAYVVRYIKANLPQYAGIPVISAAAPFKTGFGGPGDYTDIAAGPLTIRSAADLYLYPNMLAAVKTNGAGIRAWLEHSADWFNRIDPRDPAAQQLLDSHVPGYDFDVLQNGLTYKIDVTRPRGHRIVDLRYRGKPVHDGQPFIVATNNYRAYGGGHFPGLDGSSVILDAPDTNRDIIIDYIRHAGRLTRPRYGSDRNWRFVKVKTAGL